MSAAPRTVRVPPERLARWVASVAERHGELVLTASPEQVVLRAADGTVAEVGVPYPPLPEGTDAVLDRLVAHALADRTTGLALLRRGGVAVGVARGERLVSSKIERRRVQGRTAAGGWSQQRFARRRAQQTDAVVRVAADTALRLLVPRAAELDAVVLGGDRLLLRELRADRRLAPLWTRPAGPHLDVPDPRLDVLEEAARSARAVTIRLLDP